MKKLVIKQTLRPIRPALPGTTRMTSFRGPLPLRREHHYIPSTAPGRRLPPIQGPEQHRRLYLRLAQLRPAHKSTHMRRPSCCRKSSESQDDYSRASLHKGKPAATECNGFRDRLAMDCKSRRRRQECSSLRKSDSMAPILYRLDRNDSQGQCERQRDAEAWSARSASGAEMHDKAAGRRFATESALPDLQDEMRDDGKDSPLRWKKCYAPCLRGGESKDS